nr:MAG TPA: hypothetical protein [Caudoviricetes sp.]
MKDDLPYYTPIFCYHNCILCGVWLCTESGFGCGCQKYPLAVLIPVRCSSEVPGRRSPTSLFSSNNSQISDHY